MRCSDSNAIRSKDLTHHLTPSLLTDELIFLLDQAEHLAVLADALAEDGPPAGWLAAGCVVQSIWNLKTGRPAEQGILDYDIVYFDANLGAETEAAWQKQLQAVFPTLKLDVKNQARVHLWYPQKFGLKIPAFASVEAAMRTWPTTATATAVRRSQDQWDVLAPFGLDDLLALILRPNASLCSEAVYVAKSARWGVLWPELTILPWSQAIGQHQS
jgi:hypothetical protein